MSSCKGIVVKYRGNRFFNIKTGEIKIDKSFRILKKLSCSDPNCVNCDLEIFTNDYMWNGSDFLMDSFKVGCRLENNRVYKLVFVVTEPIPENRFEVDCFWEVREMVND
jgi:hypothetical protein